MQTQEMTAPPRAPADGAAERFQAKLAYEIAPAELKSVLDSLPDSICLVDVRDAQAYDEGHIPLAVNIPLEELAQESSFAPAEKTIVTYCGDGACGQSLRAALEFALRGLRVRHLVGGFAEWNRKGYPVVVRSQAW